MVYLVKSGVLLIAGFFIGASDSVVGGGNLFTVSILNLMGLPPLNAVATMQVATLFQTLSATFSFARKKLINWKQSLMFSLFGIAGGLLGVNLVLNINQETFSLVAGTLMLSLLFLIPKIYVKNKTFFLFNFISRIFARLSHKKPFITHKPKRLIVLVVFTFAMGVYGGFYGAAMGTLMLIGFFLIGEANLLICAANTKVINVLLSLIVSSIFITKTKAVAWELFFPLMLGGAVGGFLGVDLAQKLGFRYIKISLYIVTFLSAIKLLFL